MNKEQEVIALKIIEFMKSNNGYIYRTQLNNFIKYGEEQIMIVNYLDQNGGLGLIKSKSNDVYYLTPKGNQFTNFEDLEKLSKKVDEREELEVKNIRLENENLEYQKSIRGLSKDISDLTKTNLELQNKHLKKYILYSILGFIVGVLVTNWKEIIILYSE